MKTTRRTHQLLIVAAAAGGGLLLGTFANSALAPGGTGVDADAEPGRSADTRSVSALSPAVDGEEARTRAALLLEARSKRMLWFATRAENADSEEMARLRRIAGDDPVINAMLAARWAEVDPQGMFDAISAEIRAGGSYPYRIMRVLNAKWARSDPRAMEAAYDDESAFAGVESARISAAEALMQTDPEVGIGVLEKWSIRHYIPRMHGVAKWAASDPRRAAERVAALDADFAGIEAIGAVGQAWAKSDPAAALEFATGLSGKKQATFARKAMVVWAAQDLDAAIAFASAQEDPSFRGLIGAGLVERWGKTDPGAALEWAGANLRSQLRTEAIGALVGALAKDDPRAAAELVSGMDSGSGQPVAVGKLLRHWVYERGETAVTEAIEWLGNYPDKKVASAALGEAGWYLSQEHPAAFNSIVEGPHGHLVTGRVLHGAVSAQVRRSPTGALEWARGLPADRVERVEGEVVRQWVSLQPEAAMAWADAQPTGRGRELAIDSIARSFSHRPLDGLASWLSGLREAEIPRVRQIVESLNTSEKRRAAVESAFGTL